MQTLKTPTFSDLKWRILTATVSVVVLVGPGGAGSQALPTISPQQGQLGATRQAIPSAGAGGAG